MINQGIIKGLGDHRQAGAVRPSQTDKREANRTAEIRRLAGNSGAPICGNLPDFDDAPNSPEEGEGHHEMRE
jgi:hypothetical protein